MNDIDMRPIFAQWRRHLDNTVDRGLNPNVMEESPNTRNYEQIQEYQSLTIPVIRRTIPRLIAEDIVGTQPMTDISEWRISMGLPKKPKYVLKNHFPDELFEVE